MRLNLQTDLALRMLIYLSVKQGAPATIQEITQKMGLSQTHMMRVAAKLASHGLVASNRGRNGGISLSRDASEITVEEVVRAIEPDFALVQCFDDSRERCVIEPACLLNGVLQSALDAFFTELRSVTLAQLTVPNRYRLRQALRLAEPDESPAMPYATPQTS
ncbi:MAG TPA: Rrf2 family transcriptional regulator [Fimbriimonadaceae bacterium]|nr:Rrf2 family transcriptional regulator [Fimbriimonadaceae bacterium]